MEQKHPGCSTRKNFRYPPVLPVVFYDGPDTWTAEMDFRNRTALKEIFWDYIPGFKYLLIDLKSYAVEKLMKFNDSLSLVMLVDRVGTVRRKEEIIPLSKEYFEQVGLKIPGSLATLLSEVIGVLMDRFKLGEEEQEELTGYIKKKEYGAMFETLVERHWQLKDEGRAEGFAIGLTKGREEERKRAREEECKRAREEECKRAREGSRKQKRLGVSPDIIAAGFGLSLEEIEKL
jgi:hypothetical protein